MKRNHTGGYLGSPAPDYPALPPALARLLDRFPQLRRRPHAMLAHFPIVFMIAAPVFTLLALITGVKSFEVTGFHCLGGGVLFTPVAIVTGWFTWWLNYESRWLKPVVVKLVLSPVLLLVGSRCLFGVITNRQSWGGWGTGTAWSTWA